VSVTSGLAPPASWLLTTCHRNPLSGSPSLEGLFLTPHSGTGILTGCPSPTLFSLGLGPTNPTRTDLPSETLDLRRTWFSHVLRYSCRHSHSCTLQWFFQTTFSACRTLPYHRSCDQSLASVRCLSPVTLSAQPRLTSELLRTLSRVAASKPTS
jgi:hypothetical protein